MQSINYVIFVILTKLVLSATSKRPHIIFILADDLGWNDVSFHGSDQILTPNIDSLAYHGVIVHNHYSQPLCSPSRAALLTGRYPLHTGMQTSVILEPEPWGLPLNFSILPEHLNALGYTSHAVGKWHLGFYKKAYTPTKRGFTSHFGFWNGYQDYYRHTVQASFVDFEGYDMRWNNSVYWDGIGHYATDLFSERAVDIISSHDTSQPLFLYLAYSAPHAAGREEPLQAPQDRIDAFRHIENQERRIYAGMVSKLDEAVGTVLSALSDSDMLKDSIVIFVSDNGAATTSLHPNRGSNSPLRGEKGTLLEGGVRTAACIWSPMIEKRQRVFKRLFHISDWMPTIYAAAGGKAENLGQIDGVDQWPALIGREDSVHARHEILHNIDPRTGASAIRVGPLKYIKGTVLLGKLDNWSGEEEPFYLSPDDYFDQISNSTANKVLSEHSNHTLSASKIKDLRTSVEIKCNTGTNYATRLMRHCNLLKESCVFDLSKDPCERDNIYDLVQGIGVIEDFENRLKRQGKSAIKPQNKPTDPKANPRLYNNTWVNWGDLD